ncbi:MAG: ParB/RepB/Spo0J family partition protein [Lachnospiraceae bacterium]|nr:ParB/RepB/Spo0J family partition protein [Lachnospiraceae bacterium]MBR3599739.1 ParB/RepB/Spo0J family partition protein [Lachnospiraceae bacterium]
MAPKKSRLGSGLGSFGLPTEDIEATSGKAKEAKSSGKATTKTVVKEVVKEVVKPVEQTVNINTIEPNKSQPRKTFDLDALEELSASIKQYGIIQPLVVAKHKDYYELIAGERRWRAAKMAGLKEVPVVIKDYTPQEIVEIALIENIQRQDLNPIEEAMAYQRLIEEFDLTQDEVAEKVSKSRPAVSNSLRLLKLTKKVQQMLIDDMLSMGHVRALISIEDEELQYETAMYVFDKRLSVRETESYVKKLLSAPKNPSGKSATKEDFSFLYKDIEERLKSSLGTKATIKAKNKNKGKIEIEYYSEDDLDRITQMLLSAR